MSSGVNLVLNLGRSWIRVNKIDFSRQIFENFDFFHALSHKKFDFSGKDLSFTATSWQIILFLFKSHHFRTYFLYTISYNNVCHDPSTTHCGPHDPLPKIWGSRPPTPKIDAPEDVND